MLSDRQPINCIIIEDEQDAAENLQRQLTKTGYAVDISACLDTIEEAVPWLQQHKPDLIFLDIQLGDGISFEIFDHVQVDVPVIFTTSFDEYAVQAFELNSISYLFKPVRAEMLKGALEKYYKLYNPEKINERIAALHKKHQTRFLVRSGNALQPISANDIAYFHLENKHFLFIITKDNQKYVYDSTLEFLEQRLDPEMFFRINRQCIVSFDTIKKLHREKDRYRIEVEPEYREELMVSTYRTAAFKNWLDSK